MKGSGNSIKNKRDRKIYFQELAKEISEKLKNGWSPKAEVEIYYSATKLLLQGIEFKKSESVETNKEYSGNIG